MGDIYRIAECSEHRKYEGDDARIDRQRQRIYKEYIDHRTQPNGIRDDDAVDKQQYGTRNQRHQTDSLEGYATMGAEIVDEHQCRYRQQVEDMYAYGQAHAVGDNDNPSHGMRRIGLLLPFEHQPNHQSRKHRRKGVNLALDRRKPECIGKGICQRPDRSRSENRNGSRNGELLAILFAQTAGYVGNRPKHKEDAECACKSIHRIDHVGNIVYRRSEHGRYSRQQHKERSPRRMTHFEFIGDGDKFGAIPQTRRRLHCPQVGYGSNREYRPTCKRVPTIERMSVHRVRIFSYN